MVAARIATRPKGTNQHASIEAPSQHEAAELLSVARPSVQRAREVLDHTAPELAAAVDRGEIAVSAAAAVARSVPREEQAALVAEGPRAVQKAAKQADLRQRQGRRVSCHEAPCLSPLRSCC